MSTEIPILTTSNIYPISDFNRKTNEQIKRVQKSKNPEVLTANGKAAVVVIDPKFYVQLAQNQGLLETIRDIAIANEQHQKGQSKPANQVFRDFKNELKAKCHEADLQYRYPANSNRQNQGASTRHCLRQTTRSNPMVRFGF